MESAVVLMPTIVKQFEAALARGHAVLFSAPCGFGKTTTARALAPGKHVLYLRAGESAFVFPPASQSWDTLVLDDLQCLTDVGEQDALCELIREYPNRCFLLLTRGVPPSWLLPFQIAGVMTVIGVRELTLDRDSTRQLLALYGVTVNDIALTAIHQETGGCALAIVLLAQHLARGESYCPNTADLVRREIFLYYEETVFRRMELPMQRLLLELAPFEQIDLELARMVSGNSRAGELLGKLQRDTTALIQDRLDTYHFWPIFRRFLLWELDQSYSQEQLRALYSRGGLYYELKEDYGKALECYSKAGGFNKVSELLVKNAELHPGMGHYDEMEPYYRSLPEREVLASPALMQAMSMLSALHADYESSERWYSALADFAQHHRRTDAIFKEAQSRLIWLDLALPQRSVEDMSEMFPQVFRLLTKREINLPPFSVTSTLPSLMNGGKDFSPWSKKDDLLYRTLRVPVEAVLGRDGVCLADCAIAECKFEKGENIKDRILSLMSSLERIRRDGTPDIEFAVVGLLARTQLAAGRAEDARRTLETLRERFEYTGESRFFPNLDAMLCRVDMRLRNETGVYQWYREMAPKNPQQLHVMKRYQYLTQAMAELSFGDSKGALLTLTPLFHYCKTCARFIDRIHLHTISAIARFRLGEHVWHDDMDAALDIASEFGFLQSIGQYGAAVLPLMETHEWTKNGRFLKGLLSVIRTQAAFYPDFLRPRAEMSAPLSASELLVLRLLCADKSNAEIAEILGIKLPTVKVHVSHILSKLKVNRRSEARSAAQRLHLL